MEKISNVQVAGSAVTAVLKKAVLAVIKKLSQLSGKAICFGQCVLLGYWQCHFSIYFMDLAENGKISLKGISLFLV